jgi:hypothetical protein
MSTSNDPVTTFVLALLAMVVVLPVVAAWCVVVMAGRAVVWLARGGRQIIQGSQTARELQRITRERNEAIHDVLTIRNQAERQLREVARHSVVGDTAEEWRYE